MPLLIGIEMFLGYLLMYAGIHNRGKYALAPWKAMLVGAPSPGSRSPFASFVGGATPEPEAPAGPWESWS